MHPRQKRMLCVGWLLRIVIALSVSLPLSAQVNLTGTWRGTQVDTPQTEPPVPIDVTFTQSGTSLTGRITFPEFGGFNLSGTVSGAAISFQVRLAATATINYSGTIASANTITGTWVIPEADIQGTFRLDRVVAAPAPAPAINAGGVVNNASYTLTGTTIAPGTIAAIFGTNLTDGTSCTSPSCFPSFEGGRLKTTMAGASVTINGIAAPLFYATPNQIGVQIPTELSGTSASLQVTVAGRSSTAQTISLEPFSPGIFTFTQDGRGAGAITHASGTPVNPQNPAQLNEVVIIYATGLGQVTPAVPTGALPSGLTQTLTRPTATVDGIPAEVQFSGLSGCCVGLNQINVKIPANSRSGNDVPVVLTIGGKQSNMVTIAVAAAVSQSAGGPTCEFLGSPTPCRPICSLAVDPVNPAILYAGTQQNVLADRSVVAGVFKSTNGGASWTRTTSGLYPPSSCHDALVIDPLNPSVLYVTTGIVGSGIFKSSNGGGSWSPVLTSRPIYRLAIDPRNPSVLYAGSAAAFTFGSGAMFGGLVKSTNGGGTWASAGLLNTFVYSLAVDPIHPTTVYVGYVRVEPADPNVCCTYNHKDRGLLKSTDAGTSWTEASAGLPQGTDTTALAIDPINPSILYAGTRSSGFFKSTNGGESWTAANSGLPNLRAISAIVIDPANSSTLYAATGGALSATGGGVFKSTNGAGNWTAANSGLTELDIHALVIDPRNPSTLYAGTASRGVFKTTNGGQSWQPTGR